MTRLFRRRAPSVATVLVAVSRALVLVGNLAAQILIAALFGTGWQLDAYFAAMSLPLFVTGVLQATIHLAAVPAMTAHRERSSEETYRWFVHRVVMRTFLAAVVLAGVGTLTSREASGLLFSGLDERRMSLTVRLNMVAWGTVPLAAISALMSSLFHARREFLLPALLNLCPAVGVICLLPLLSQQVGIYSLFLGYATGVFVQAAALTWMAWCGGDLRLLARGEALAEKVRIGSPLLALVTVVPPTLFPVINRMYTAGMEEGAISSVEYGLRFAIMMSAVFGQAVEATSFPMFSSSAGRDAERFRGLTRKVTRLVLFCVTPMGLTLAILSRPLAQVLLQRGMFDERAMERVAAVATWYLLGSAARIPAGVLTHILIAGGSVRVPPALSVAKLVLYVGLCSVLVPAFSYVGIGVAFAVTWCVGLAVLAVFTWRRVGPFSLRSAVDFGSRLAAGAAAAGVTTWWLYSQHLREGPALVALLVGGLAGFGVYALMSAYVLRQVEMRQLMTVLRRRHWERADK